MSIWHVEWASGDALLDEALSRHFRAGFIESPYGFMIFRRMSHLQEYMNPSVVYGHLIKQESKYEGKNIPTLCGNIMNLYAVSEIASFDSLSQLDEEGLCESCCSQAEKVYWLEK